MDVNYDKRIDEFHSDQKYEFDQINPNSWNYLMKLSSVLERYFRYKVENIDRIPRKKAAIIIAFHGLLSVDALFLSHHIYKDQGRKLRILTDKRIYAVPYFRKLVIQMGAVEACHECAEIILRDRKELLLIMPGGAKECWKSSLNKYRVMWDNRKGFIKLAIKTQTPIIPTVCAGIEELYFNPINGMTLTEKLFGKEFFLPLSIPLGLGILPFPSQLTQLIGKPISFSEFKPEDSENEELVDKMHRKVKRAMIKLIKNGIEERQVFFYEMRKKLYDIRKHLQK